MKPQGPSETYVLSSSPHARADSSVRDIMLDVIVAAVPAVACGIAFIWRADPAAGLHSLLVVATCVLACAAAESLCRLAMRREQTLGDLSCVVTGLLLAATLPPGLPLWMCAAGSVFAIAVAKQAFGGLGYNPFNPAAAGRAFMLVSFTGAMTTWSRSGWIASVAHGGAGNMAAGLAAEPGVLETCATPLAAMRAALHSGEAGALVCDWRFLGDLFAGDINGSIGEISSLALLLGGAYLLWRRVITWHVPAAFLGTMAAIAFAALPCSGGLCETSGARAAFAAAHVLSGGAVIAAFFMATDMVTGPVTAKGKLVFGCGCGAVTMAIRLWGAYPEGASFAILVMNAFAPLIDRFTRPVPFGRREALRAAKRRAAEEKRKAKSAPADAKGAV